MRGDGGVDVVLLGDGGVHAASNDVLVGSLLEVDQHAHSNLSDEDYNQKHEKLKKERRGESDKNNDLLQA